MAAYDYLTQSEDPAYAPPPTYIGDGPMSEPTDESAAAEAAESNAATNPAAVDAFGHYGDARDDLERQRQEMLAHPQPYTGPGVEQTPDENLEAWEKQDKQREMYEQCEDIAPEGAEICKRKYGPLPAQQFGDEMPEPYKGMEHIMEPVAPVAE